MAFPLVLRESQITLEDVERLALPLAEVAKARTGCRDFRWFGVEDHEAIGGLPEPWQQAVAAAVADGVPQRLEDDNAISLCLPLGGCSPVAVLLLVGVAARKWPAEALQREIEALGRHLAVFREYYADPLTGLANSLLLQRQVEESLARDNRGVLLLVELYPPGRDAEKAWGYLQKAGRYLASLFGAAARLFHLGSGIFALLWDENEMADAQQAATLLLNRLRREGFVRAHIGMRQLARTTEAELLDEAWQALAVARKRGPFGLAVHEEAGAASPFPTLSRNEQRKVAAWWRGKERFALVLVRQDQEAASNHFTKRLRAVLDKSDASYLLLSQREALVFLDGAGSTEATKWTRRFRKGMAQSAGATFSMGIALYPCHSFTKAQLPVNCRKALQHAEFFGPGSQAIFDAVSCNISGDVYYNGGDITRAVREYRLGLALDPANVNLLNSLGVAYTQLMRPRMALQCFEAALRHEQGNFMALFNLGFLHLHRQETAKALDCFERALASNNHHFDLLLQLGKLYCRQKRFAEAAKLLERCVTDGNLEERRNGDRAAAWRLLGEARAGLGENKKAILAFQKVLSFTHRDAQALSMLGELYAREKEGDEIALSLCQEAVTLDSAHGEHWRRLAWVQWSRGDADAAIASLKQCLQLDRKNSAALFWLARIYREQGRLKEAHRLYEKVLRLQPNHAEAQSALAQVQQ